MKLRPLILGLVIGPPACTAIVEPDRSRLETAPPCDFDDDCDDGRFCNGAEACVAHTCRPGPDPCLDGVRCTVDRCDEDALIHCTSEPADELCPQIPPQRCDAVQGCVQIPG